MGGTGERGFRGFTTLRAVAWMVALLSVAALAPAARAAEVAVDFEAQPEGTFINAQYADLGGPGQGVTFAQFTDGPKGNAPLVQTVPTGAAHSGAQVGQIGPFGSVEFPDTETYGKFSAPKGFVRVFAGFNSSDPRKTEPVTLTAYDALGHELTHATTNVPASSQVKTMLQVVDAQRRIVYFRVAPKNDCCVSTPNIRIDDLTFDVPAPGEPVPNTPPAAALDLGCDQVSGFGGPGLFCPGMIVRQDIPTTFDASPSRDPDGTIARYDWDFDGNGTYDQSTGATPKVTHTYSNAGAAHLGVQVTDDDGATASTSTALVVEAKCVPSVAFKRMTAISACLKAKQEKAFDGQVVTYSSTSLVNVNGIKVVPRGGKRVQILVLLDAKGKPFGSPIVRADDAQVYVPVQGRKLVLHTGKLRWTLHDGRELGGFKVSSFNGLKANLTGPPTLSADRKTSRIELFPVMPQGMGGATPAKPTVLRPGAGAAAQSGAFTFSVPSGALGPIGLKNLTVSYDGDGLWQIAGSVALPDPIPYDIKAALGIDKGAFSYGEAEVDNLNVGPFGPGIYLQRIKFRIEVKPTPKTSTCVRHIGKEKFDTWSALLSAGFSAADLKQSGLGPEPRYLDLDHGFPDFALCGEVGLTAGPKILGESLVGLDAGLRFTTFPDRPTILGGFGKVYLVGIPLAQADFEFHTNGYMRMNADIDANLADIVSAHGSISFEMYLPKFNAWLSIKACIDPIGFCAGAKAGMSSKGVAVCLRIPTPVGTWRPGVGWEWGTVPDLYFSGCSIGPYQEEIQASSAGRRVAKAAGAQQTLDIPAGLPGAAVTVTGQGASPKVTLHGPKGETISTPAGDQAVQAPTHWLIKDRRHNTTSIALIAPSAGRWTVRVDPDSVPVTSIRQAAGLKEPSLKAKITGQGHRRVLRYRVTPRKGQVVTFVEDGPSAGKRLGIARAASGRLRFTPADGRAEARPVFAVVEQDGMVVDRVKVASYRAPGPFHPTAARGLVARRRGTALALRWRRVAGAAGYEVRVALGDGRRLFFRPRAARLRVARVPRRLAVRVTVRAVSEAALRGKPAAARIRAGRSR